MSDKPTAVQIVIPAPTETDRARDARADYMHTQSYSLFTEEDSGPRVSPQVKIGRKLLAWIRRAVAAESVLAERQAAIRLLIRAKEWLISAAANVDEPELETLIAEIVAAEIHAAQSIEAAK